MKYNYPVVFFVFKRPASTKSFLALMKSAGINKIYVFADGPRSGEDKKDTDLVRINISDFAKANPGVHIITKFSPKNIGLKQNIITGLNQVFKYEEAAIVMEDDCLPTPDFFRFTREMLGKYKNNDRVMSVNGTSTGGDFHSSYDFTKYSQCWGWATWRRAWKRYDWTLSKFDKDMWQVLVKNLRMNGLLRWYWYTILTVVKSGWISTWDYQWSFAHFYHDGLAIAPSVNLVKNIGFDKVATNTKTKTRVADMQTSSLTWPLVHPQHIEENMSISRQIEKHFYSNPIAVLGLIRQCFYLNWSKYVRWH